MELRRLALCMGFFLLAVSQCSAHLMHRREADDDLFGDTQADEASDDEAQNDTEVQVNDPNEKEKTIKAVILTPPTLYDVEAGSDVTLQCKVSPEAGAVVQWNKGNESLFLRRFKTTNAENYVLDLNSNNLILKNVQPSDSGSFTCYILQTGSEQVVNHTVLVKYSPKILNFTASNNGVVMEGSDLLLTCDVDGVPPPKVIWSRDISNGNERLFEKDGEFTVNSVHIRNLQLDQSGKYYCYTFNKVGSNQSEINITVLGKPKVQVPKTIVNSAIDVEAILECTAHGSGSPHIRWYKDGRLMEDSRTRFEISSDGLNSNLTIVPAKDDDFGTYTCEAENEHGKHNRSVELVQSPVIEELNADGPKLSWTVHSHQPLEAIELQLKDSSGDGEWRAINVPLPSTVDHKYTISYSLADKLLESGKYEAIVKVKNIQGWAISPDHAIVDIEALPQYIQHASVFAGSDAHSIRSEAAILSTVLMYLLVRML